MDSCFSYMATPQYINMKKGKSDKKKLELLITNYSAEAVAIENSDGVLPDEYPRYDDKPQENDPQGFYLFFYYGNRSGDLTAKENAASIMVGALSSDWDVSYVMDSEKAGAYWIIAPKKTVTIAAHDSISIEISDIYCNGTAGETPINIEYRAKGRTFFHQAAIYKMFKLDYNLSCMALPEYLTVNHEESFQVMITNDASSSIAFNNPSKLLPEEYPKYDDFANENSAAGFYLFFYYGDEGGDIVTKENSVNYSVNVMDNPKWKVGYGDSPTVGRYWKICPVETSVMKPHETLVFRIDKLKTNQKTGLTLLNLELRADGRILPDKLGLMKLKKPVIKSFGPKKEDCDINETATLCWEVENGDGCSSVISTSSGITDVSGIDACDMKMIDSAFTLIVKNMAGFSVSKTYTPQFLFITRFQAVDCDGEYVTLQWETRNGDRCWIQWDGGRKEVRLSGEEKVPAKKGSADEFQFTLILRQKDSFVEHTKDLKFGYAQITKFSRSSRFYSCLEDVSMELSGENPFVTLEEISRLAVAPIVILPYDGGGPRTNHDGVEWDGRYVEFYILDGKYRYSGDKGHWQEFSWKQSCTLRAYSIGGKVYEERTI